MPWEIFLTGFLAGWLVEFALDYFFWRPRRICTEVEQELREAVAILEDEVLRLRRRQGDEQEAEEDEDEEEEKRDDLQKIWGIGPKVETVLWLQGITTFDQLAATDHDELEKMLESAGDRFRISKHNIIESWQEQAQLAAAGQWAALETYHKELAHERRRRAGRRNR